MPIASAPASARYAVTWPGPQPTSTTGPPSACTATRSSSHVSKGCCPRSSSTRWSAYVVATASYDDRTRSSRAAPPAARTDSRSTAGAASATKPSVTVTSPSRCTHRLSCWPRCRGSSRTSGSGRAARSARTSSTSPRSAKRVQPVGARPQLPGRLRAAEQQHGHQRPLGVVQLEHLGEQLVVLQGASPLVGPHDADQLSVLEPAQGRLDRRLVVVDDRIAAARLVAARAHGRRASSGTTPGRSPASRGARRGRAAPP